jgi:hypothetical protein
MDMTPRGMPGPDERIGTDDGSTGGCLGGILWYAARTAVEQGPQVPGDRDRVTNPAGQDRRHVAVVVTSDGRRVTLPVASGLVGIPAIDRILDLLLGLVGLITGSRRENGGTR